MKSTPTQVLHNKTGTGSADLLKRQCQLRPQPNVKSLKSNEVKL